MFFVVSVTLLQSSKKTVFLISVSFSFAVCMLKDRMFTLKMMVDDQIGKWQQGRVRAGGVLSERGAGGRGVHDVFYQCSIAC